MWTDEGETWLASGGQEHDLMRLATRANRRTPRSVGLAAPHLSFPSISDENVAAGGPELYRCAYLMGCGARIEKLVAAAQFGNTAIARNDQPVNLAGGPQHCEQA